MLGLPPESVRRMPDEDFRGCLNHLERYEGDWRTQMLVARLCAIQVSSRERVVHWTEFAPWLKPDEDHEPDPYAALETESLEEYMERIG